MNHKPIDKAMLILVAGLILVLALLNIFQTERPTISEAENRVLATWPEWNTEDVASGKYFADIMAFFSDTFYGREALVSLSKKMDMLKGYYDEDFSVIVDPNATQPPATEDEPVPTLPPLPPVTTPPTTVPTEPSTVPTEPSVPSTGPTDPSQPISEPTEPTEPPKPPVIPITLSDSTVSLTVGAAHSLTATVGEGFSNLQWTSDNPAVASVTDNGNGTATVKALAAGTAAISATVTGEDGEKTTCVCVFTVTQPTVKPPSDVADFLPDGLFIYKGAAYSQSYFQKTGATNLGKLYAHIGQLFPNTRVSVVVAPMATITIDDPAVTKKISDQGAVLDKIEGVMPDGVNFVNLKNIFREHRTEYLFFKSDIHWTQRGAYYAYYAFAESIGLTPTPIDDFEKVILTDKYIGDMYHYTGDERVKTFYDTLEAYIPTKDCTMTITNSTGTAKFDYCINTNSKKYSGAFIRGDNGYTVINVPENPQDMTALVFKDSYGIAFVPYLVEHYGNIIVIDARHTSVDLLEDFGSMNITDIIFVNNNSSMTTTWYKRYYEMID